MILSRKTKPDQYILYLHFHTFWGYIYSYDIFLWTYKKSEQVNRGHDTDEVC